MGYNRDDNVGTMEPNTITILEIEPDVLITRFEARTVFQKILFEFMSTAPSKAFKKKNLVFTFPELSLPAVNFPLVRYVTAGADILCNWRRRRRPGAVELDNR